MTEPNHTTFREVLESFHAKYVQLTLTSGPLVYGILVLHKDYVSIKGFHGAYPIAHIVNIMAAAPAAPREINLPPA
jgi:hypothetical protein